MSASSGTMARFLTLAALGATVDLLTKALATGLLRDGSVITLTERTALTLVYNTGVSGGASLGAMTGVFNMMATFVAIAMVLWIVKPLAVVDARAVLALSLVTGGAVGNLASMLTGPAGVADFFAVRLSESLSVVMNAADLLLWSGALLLVPVVWTLLRAVRAQRAAGG
jgi:signal peptidase II